LFGSGTRLTVALWGFVAVNGNFPYKEDCREFIPGQGVISQHY
jgi:hypothetical protein